jgi:hypothetical protein
MPPSARGSPSGLRLRSRPVEPVRMRLAVIAALRCEKLIISKSHSEGMRPRQSVVEADGRASQVRQPPMRCDTRRFGLSGRLRDPLPEAGRLLRRRQRRSVVQPGTESPGICADEQAACPPRSSVGGPLPFIGGTARCAASDVAVRVVIWPHAMGARGAAQ